MNNIDWEKWMADHHVKIGGKSHEGGKNEMCSGGGVSRTEVETEVSDDAGPPGYSNIQKSQSI